MYKFKYNEPLSIEEAVLLLFERLGEANPKVDKTYEGLTSLDNLSGIDLKDSNDSYLILIDLYNGNVSVNIVATSGRKAIISCNTSKEVASVLQHEDGGVLLENTVFLEENNKDITKIQEPRKDKRKNSRYGVYRDDILDILNDEYINYRKPICTIKEDGYYINNEYFDKNTVLLVILGKYNGFIKCNNGKYLTVDYSVKTIKPGYDYKKESKPGVLHFVTDGKLETIKLVEVVEKDLILAEVAECLRYNYKCMTLDIKDEKADAAETNSSSLFDEQDKQGFANIVNELPESFGRMSLKEVYEYVMKN